MAPAGLGRRGATWSVPGAERGAVLPPLAKFLPSLTEMLLRPSASPPPFATDMQSVGGENVRQDGLWLTNFPDGDKMSVDK